MLRAAVLVLCACGALGCDDDAIVVAPMPRVAGYDPLARARAFDGVVVNAEAAIPAACYTKTGSASNPCYVCHSVSASPFGRDDIELQQRYSFSEAARSNHWLNLFVDRRAATKSMSDSEILAYVRQDNYGLLMHTLAGVADYPGWVPDLDLSSGFDADGFARDGSGWRALRYLPFPGTFWPTNGSADDVFIRLPAPFRREVNGAPNLAIHRLNFAILEAAMTAGRDELEREIEPVDERLADFDLDGDGELRADTDRVRHLPSRFAGGARDVAVERWVMPAGVEFMHSVRYLDPDAPHGAARRMKELRYMRKVERLDLWAALRAQEGEVAEKAEGKAPVYRGNAFVGLRNAFGWQLQAFIEDEKGRLRLQTEEEHRACMGCHGGIGITIDSTFSFARKLPGMSGFAVQDLRAMKDPAGEVLTYFQRVGAADELRENDEMRGRFFAGGGVDDAAVRRASIGGDQDLMWLLYPSRSRALALDKAYRALVREQRFERGRDAPLAPPSTVHQRIIPGPTELAASTVYADASLVPRWP